MNVRGQHQSAGRFVEVVPDEQVVFTFGWDEPDHPIPAGSTTMTITLIPEGDKTRVQLVHSGLPADAVSDHTKRVGPLPGPAGHRGVRGDPGPDSGTGPS